MGAWEIELEANFDDPLADVAIDPDSEKLGYELYDAIGENRDTADSARDGYERALAELFNDDARDGYERALAELFNDDASSTTDQTASGDQGTEQVASGDQGSKQSSLSDSAADQVLPSPEICVEIKDFTHMVFGEEHQILQITNGCPAPVLVLYLERIIHHYDEEDRVYVYISPNMDLSLRETYAYSWWEGDCKPPVDFRNLVLGGCIIDVVQPGYITGRALTSASLGPRSYDYVVCAQYHPLSLDAASGPARVRRQSGAFHNPGNQPDRLSFGE